MGKNSSQNKDDVYITLTEDFKKIHVAVEQLTPIHTQSLSNLQQEYLAAWKNIMCSNISIHQLYANRAGVNTDKIEIFTNTIHKITDEFIQGIQVQSKFIQTFWDTSKQNIECVNKNVEKITESNRDLINFWGVKNS